MTSSRFIPSELQEKLEQLGISTSTRDAEQTLDLELSDEGVEPNWNETELVIRLILSELAARPEKSILPKTTIFKIGLDSISAVQVASALRKKGYQVAASDVLAYPTCRDLAKVLAKPVSSSTRYDLSSFQRDIESQISAKLLNSGTIESLLPCTPAQCGMLAAFIQSQQDHYFNLVSLRLGDGFTMQQVRESLETVAAADPMLRTGFTPIDHADSSFGMVQYKPRSVSHHIMLVGGADAARFKRERWRRNSARQVREDLSKPPWYVAIVKTGTKTVVHVAILHALYDAFSLRILLGNIGRALERRHIAPVAATNRAVCDIMCQILAAPRSSDDAIGNNVSGISTSRFPILTPLRNHTGSTKVVRRVCSNPWKTLKSEAMESGFTIQAFLQAAWTRVLSAYTGETSVAFGVVLSGRQTDATLNAIFPCLTTLPVIANNETSNEDILRQMMKYNATLQRLQHLPISHVQRLLNLPDAKAFDTLLVFQKLSTHKDDELPFAIIDEQASVDFPVSLEAEPQREDMVFTLTFHDNILPEEQARIILDQFDNIFCHLLKHPIEQLDDIIDDAPQIFSILSAEEPELPGDETLVHHFVELQAGKNPTKTALRFISGHQGSKVVKRDWSYQELDCNGNKVASLVAEQISPGALVAVCFDKCPEAYFSILGILKSGCAFVALDPGAPISRKKFILEDSRASLLLTNLPGFDDISTPVLDIRETDLENLPTNTSSISSRTILPTATCYCLYTSGTTGLPKGCEISHDNTVQSLRAFQRLFNGNWDQGSRWLQFASLHFDVSVLEQYWTWSVGIMLVAAPRELILDDLSGFISRHNITHIDLTPSLASLVHPRDVPSLCRGVFITGGEQLRADVLENWGPTGAVHNFYGPTEATIGVTSFPHVPQNGRPSNIGRQFPNVGTYVLRQGTDIPVLRGGIGELCVSGRLVGKGYLNRPDLTRDKFPILSRFGERVYRTGDLVRVLHDGCYDFLGRADDQVKLRGMRLETGEINSVARSSVPELADIATLLIRDEKLRKDVLVSFYVDRRAMVQKDSLRVITDRDSDMTVRSLRESWREKLPEYMVPVFVFQISFMPLSVNNKADMGQLRALFNSLEPAVMSGTQRPDGQDVAILSQRTGSKVKSVLQSMGALKPGQSITTDTTIFDLGIDSISALRFSRALNRIGVHATPSLILHKPRLFDLIEALRDQQNSASKASVRSSRLIIEACGHQNMSVVCTALRVQPDDIEYIAPCSALQQGMISRSRMGDKNNVYFNQFNFGLKPEVDVEVLRQTWQVLYDSLAILRTRFVSTRDGHVQVALRFPALPWRDIELGYSEDISKVLHRELDEWTGCNEEVIGEPLRILLVRQPKHPRKLVLQLFHGVYDATSLDILLDQVVSIYSETKLDSESPSFLDGLLHGLLSNYSHSRNFWERHLQGAYLTSFPRLDSTQSSSHLTISAKRRVPFGELSPVRTSLQITSSAIVQALWAIALANLRQVMETTIGIVVSGRSLHLDLAESIIGPLFNTIPFHVKLDQTSTWASVVKKCHDFNVVTLEFQQTPLRDIQKWCSDGQSLFDTLFSFQILKSSDPNTPQLWYEEESETRADYPLALEVLLENDDNLDLLLVAQKDLVTVDMLERLFDSFERAAAALMANPSGLICDLFNLPAQDAESTRSNTLGYNSKRDSGAEEPLSALWTEEALHLRSEIALLAGVASDTISMSTGLLELGLDSIDILKLSARLKTFDIFLTPGQLNKGQSISNLLSMLDRYSDSGISTGSRGSAVAPLIAQLREHLTDKKFDFMDVEAIYPPTPLQEALVSEMIQSGFQTYFNHNVLELGSAVDLSRFKMAWEMCLQNYPILRTGFIHIDSPDIGVTYCQVVRTYLGPVIEEFEGDDNDQIAKTIQANTFRAIQASGQRHLFQLSLLRGKNQVYLIISVAHALYDGWSLDLLFREVKDIYHDVNHVFKPVSPLDHLGQVLAVTIPEAHEFWRGYLATSRPSILPKSRELPLEASVTRSELESSVSISTIEIFCKQNGISQLALGQTCWAAVLSSRLQALDVVFGVVLSGRDSLEAQELMFPTMNTVAVRIILHGDGSKLSRYVQENTANIRLWQHYPLRKAHRAAGLDNQALFNTLFIMQQSLGIADELSDTDSLMRSIGGSAEVEYPVCVEMEVVGDAVLWRAACDTQYISEDSTNKLLCELDSVLDSITGSPRADVLAFEGSQVRICGLPAFTPETETNDTPEIEGSISVPISQDTDDWSATESRLRDVLSRLTGVAPLGIARSDTAYHIGLDSISAIKASSLLKHEGLNIRPRDIIRASSITEMATLVSLYKPQSSENGRDEDAVPFNARLRDAEELLRYSGLDMAAVEDVLPATAMQVHMLAVCQNSKGAIFFPEFRYKLTGVFNQSTIEEAWRRLKSEYPILRTTFVAAESAQTPVVQVVLAPVTHGDHAGSNTSSALQSLADLSVELSSEDYILVKLRIHHALYDAFSLPLMLQRLAELCDTANITPQQQGHPAWGRLTALRASKDAHKSRQKFWTDYLSNQPHGQHFPDSEVAFPDERCSLLRTSAVSGVTSLARQASEEGFSIQSLLFAAYAQVLAHKASRDRAFTTSRSVVFGVYLANRGLEEDLLRLPYPTLTLVPLRVDFQPGSSLLDVAKAIQKDVHDISSEVNTSVGLWEITDWTDVVVDTFFNYLGSQDDGSTTAETLSGILMEATTPIERGRSPEVPEVTHDTGDSPLLNAFPVRLPSSPCISRPTDKLDPCRH
jgi:ferricrocin synthase